MRRTGRDLSSSEVLMTVGEGNGWLSMGERWAAEAASGRGRGGGWRATALAAGLLACRVGSAAYLSRLGAPRGAGAQGVANLQVFQEAAHAVSDEPANTCGTDEACNNEQRSAPAETSSPPPPWRWRRHAKPSRLPWPAPTASDHQAAFTCASPETTTYTATHHLERTAPACCLGTARQWSLHNR